MGLLFSRRGLGLRCLHATAILAIAIFSFFHAMPSRSAQNGLLVSEPFAGATGALHGLNGGAGWAGPWQVQNNGVAVPGYNVASTNPLSAAGVTQTGNYAVGGSNWQSSGRPLDTSAGGSLAPYVSNGLVGVSGQTVYLGLLMRKDVNTDDEMSVTLHPGNNPAWFVNSPGISVGHFGGSSNSGGIRYWSLKFAGAVHRTTVPVVVGQTAFLVVKVDFGATTQISFYVNPPTASLPATADFSMTTASSAAFRSVAWYPGSGSGQSSLDEIRLSASYNALVAGTTPPPATPANLSTVPGNGQVALSWSAVSGASAYKVFRIVNGVAQVEATPTSNAAIISGLTNRIAYTFAVAATNAAGTSALTPSVTVVPRGPAPAPLPTLGTNLSQVTDYSRELPFVDVFKSARPWISQLQGAPWGQGPALQLDSNGWITSLQPGQYAETIMLDNALDDQASYPVGQYSLLYDGEGTIAFDLQSATIVSQTPGRMVVNVPAGQNGVFLMVTATNPANPLRNIRFIMPGFEGTYQKSPFNPVFLKSLQGYKTLRFMEWMLINGSNIQNWSERPTPTDYTYNLRGVPLEVCIQLANTLKLTPWFNIPAKASDDYMRQFALVVSKQLTSGINFYLEYSNETWNGGFSQNAWMRAQGMALGFSTDPTIATADYTAYRSVQMFNIFQPIFATGSRSSTRMIRVIASQAGNSWLSDQTLGFQNAFASADALAIAPYFNCDDTATGGFGVLGDPATATQVAGMTVDQVIDIELAHINGCAKQQMTSNATIAGKYGIKMVAYEGGQSLVGYWGAENNTAMTALFKAANRSPRMVSLYTQYLANWVAAGGDLFAHFSDVTAFSKYGSWGALEYQDQDPNTAPKYQALMTFATQHQ